MNAQASQAVTTLQKCSGEIDKLADAINFAISLIPAPIRGLIGDVIRKWDEFCAQAKKLFDLFAEVTSYGLGDPGALRKTADAWKTSATELLVEAAKTVSKPELQGVRSWEGPAATAYQGAIAKQQEAITAVKESAKMIAEALGTHADSIEKFWGNILNGLVNFLLSLAGVVVSALALVPPVTALGVIGLIISVASALKSIWDLFATEISDLDQFADAAKSLGEKVMERFSEEWPALVA